MLTGWRYYWRRYLGILPAQPCYICGALFWVGLGHGGWVDYCSRKCAGEDLDRMS